MIFVLCRYIWGLAPPPPHTKKLATLLLPAFAHQKSSQMNFGRFRPPHSLHEIAATGYINVKFVLQSYRLNSLLSLRHEHCLFPSNLTLSLLPTDIDECSSNPCRNGGLCIDLINSYQCVCQPGYNGINCKIGEHYFHIMSKHLSLFRRGWVGREIADLPLLQKYARLGFKERTNFENTRAETMYTPYLI